MQAKNLSTILNREFEYELFIVTYISFSRYIINSLFRSRVETSQPVLSLRTSFIIYEGIQNGIQSYFILLFNDSSSVIQGSNKIPC